MSEEKKEEISTPAKKHVSIMETPSMEEEKPHNKVAPKKGGKMSLLFKVVMQHKQNA